MCHFRSVFLTLIRSIFRSFARSLWLVTSRWVCLPTAAKLSGGSKGRKGGQWFVGDLNDSRRCGCIMVYLKNQETLNHSKSVGLTLKSSMSRRYSIYIYTYLIYAYNISRIPPEPELHTTADVLFFCPMRLRVSRSQSLGQWICSRRKVMFY